MLSVDADCAAAAAAGKKQSCDDAKMLSGDDKRNSEGPTVKRSTDKPVDMGGKLGGGPTYGLVKPVQSVSVDSRLKLTSQWSSDLRFWFDFVGIGWVKRRRQHQPVSLVFFVLVHVIDV